MEHGLRENDERMGDTKTWKKSIVTCQKNDINVELLLVFI